VFIFPWKSTTKGAESESGESPTVGWNTNWVPQLSELN
jgi:hypothetical protein